MLLCSPGLPFALMVLVNNFQGHYFHIAKTSNFLFVFLKSFAVYDILEVRVEDATAKLTMTHFVNL